MAAVSAAAGWTAEDDVLLKNAVEAGASLESLAKGAVCFSHKFTLQELQDRWYSLLYDSETSAQASARMAKYEMELSVSNPAKATKLFNSKAKCFSLFKRKIDSVKNQYYAMRKRVCHEPCLSADFGYVIAPCSCNPTDGRGCACGGRHLDHKVDPSVAVVSCYGFMGGPHAERKHVHSNSNGQCSFHTDHSDGSMSMVMDGNTNHESSHGYSDADQLYGYDSMQKDSQTSGSNIASADNRSDLSEQFDNGAKGSKDLPGIDQDQDGARHCQFSGNSTGGLLEPGSIKAISQKLCPQEHRVPTWIKVLGVNSPDTLTDTHIIEPKTLMLSGDKKMETNISDALAFQENFYSAVPDSSLGSAMASKGGFMHSHLKGFSQKEDLELLSGEHSSDSALDTNQKDLGPHTFDTTNCSNHIDPIQKKQNVADVSGVDTIPASSELLYPELNAVCMLNTEDCEIPCNDHMLIPGQSSLQPTSTIDQDSQHDACLVLAKLINMENAQASTPSPPAFLESSILEQNTNMVSHGDFGGNNANLCLSALHSVNGGEETACGFVKHEYCDNLRNLTLNKSIQGPYQMNGKFLSDKPKIGCETAIKSCELSHALPDTEFHNPLGTMLTSSEAEGSDSETSVPNYFDIEALVHIILDRDLIPWDQESDFIQPKVLFIRAICMIVSRFQCPESRKDLIRLEKGACSYMNRSIMSKGAFAILYGQRLKCYIRDPEVILSNYILNLHCLAVTLGRETGEVHVDIDLGKEGKANKISRRQAVIKMDDGGPFFIKNIGKCSIFVNSKEVPCNKRISLISDSLLEYYYTVFSNLQIRNMKFIFHVNHDAVKKYIARTRIGSYQGKITAFDWSQDP
ncbi:hypothetical protein BAE44_0003841 [Dichanthelium oligosanthes]|uniref:FHA domain-containing protein n=1 Tax=Dichanthelium oligosanthes TaxID=888268 RepID=A0A1E5WCM7_9POAL|nr:hypothetical protein BAE44_0003841 [Dichanthelium oligosanthes]